MINLLLSLFPDQVITLVVIRCVIVILRLDPHSIVGKIIRHYDNLSYLPVLLPFLLLVMNDLLVRVDETIMCTKVH